MTRNSLFVCLLLTSSCTFLSRPDSQTEAQCDDLIDNDGNALIDCEDPACADAPECAAEDLPPVAVDDTGAIDEDIPALIPVALLLENDTDPEGQALQISSVSNASDGVVSLNGDEVEFIPDANFNGVAFFDYTVEDPAGNSDVGTVAVTFNPVNDAPTTINDAFTINEDSGLNLDPQVLLSNDFDVDGDEISFLNVGGGINGSAFTKGNIGFFPDFDFSGAASFEYTIEDELGEVATGVVNVTVNPVNDAPVAFDDTAIAEQDLSLEIPIVDLLSNDVDVDSTPTIIAIQSAQNCDATLDGSDVIVSAFEGFSGTASFEYTITDGEFESTAVVTVTVLPAACGNNIFQTGEQCDDGNNINDDACSNACLLPICGDTIVQSSVGEACDDGNQIALDGCDAVCVVEVCGDGIDNNGNTEACDDGNQINDDACSNACLLAACADGIVQSVAGETCDDGNLTSGDGCDAACVVEICGDGIDNNGNTEACDDGNQINNDACTNACLLPACGDSIVQGSVGEQCDDGNTANNDGCNAVCILETPALCGDAAVNAGEGCDDGNILNGDGCNAACQLEECGDGLTNNVSVQPAQSVEFIWLGTSCAGPLNINFAINGVPALTTEGDPGTCTCLPGIRSLIVTETAVLAAIQDGANDFSVSFVGGEGGAILAWAVAVVDNGLTQEVIVFDASGGVNAQGRNPDLCSANLADVNASNTADIDLIVGEQCDDGNIANGDGCNDLCQLEVCGDGVDNNGNAEQCDDGNDTGGDGCDVSCQLEVCGDSIVNNAGLEQCDDGNQNNLDACRNNCQLPVCGDNIVDAGEACDDGNTVAGDGCRANCSGLEVCGDGIVDSLAGEQCDDSNLINNDGCDNQCLLDPFNNVPAQIISGGLSCVTNLSNTGRKISSDALGNFYAVMNCGGEAFVVSSTDRGFSYTAPLSTGITGISEVAIEGGPNNTAYVAAISGSNVVFTRTINGGATWEAPIVLDAAAGDPEISIESFGDNVYLMYSVGNLRLLQNNNRGQGAFVTTDIAQTNVFHDVIIDKIDESVIAASDDPAFHLRRSTDGGLTFAGELNPPGQAFFSDWTGSNGFIYVVGTNNGDGATDIDVIPTANLSVGTSIQGLPSTASSSSRAIDSDAIGNAYVVSQLDQGGIQLDRMLFAAPSILSTDARAVSAQGTFPGVAALPSNNGALIVFTQGTDVFAAVEVYPVCGDGIIEGEEQCEDGNAVGGDGCDAQCVLEVCGNGIVQAALGEICDDGNANNGDGCDSVCIVEVGFTCVAQPSVCAPICGDNLVIGAEQCDDGAKEPGDGCSEVCLIEVCGDGVVNNSGLEACDDGNITNGDGCNSVCVVEFCGDNITNNGEACDDGNNDAGDGCRADCLGVEVCGDGFFDPIANEECDDGNNTSIDGCDAACVIEFCGDNITNVSGSAPQSIEFIWLATSCAGPLTINFAINGTIALSTLGNIGDCRCDPGISSFTVTDPAVLDLVQDGTNDFFVSFVDGTGSGLLAWAVAIVNSDTAQEVVIFDNGGGNDAQNRNPDLCNATLGNDISFVTPASLDLLTVESCDDGATVAGDGCNEFCQLEVCGDGIVNNAGLEACDDGNVNNDDGCDSACAIEPIGGDVLEITNLTTNNCQIVEHVGVTGDDRGGIAIGSSHVLYTGDSVTGVFDRNTLAATPLGIRFDSLFSDLGTGTIYSFGNGGTPISNPGGTINSLLEIDPFTGNIVNQIDLSQSIQTNSSASSSGAIQNGIFAGAGRVVLLATPNNGTSFEAFDIDISTGQVISRGAMAPIARQGCENWATWGVVELRGNSLFLTYTDNTFPVTQIRRTRIPDGFTEVVSSFTNLSEMCSFSVSPLQGRWYFHFEGVSQIGGSDESIGFCNALIAL